MILGITGSSGSGKSKASEIFANNGFTIIDSDRISHKIATPGSPYVAEIKANFGDGVIRSDGSLDRRALGDIVFGDKSRLPLLNSVTHKYILAEMKKRMAMVKGDILLDVPLLFESEIYKWCDYTLGVISERQLQIQRLQKRDGISANIAAARLDSQQSNDFYRQNCDYIIENSLSENELADNVLRIIDEIRHSDKA